MEGILAERNFVSPEARLCSSAEPVVPGQLGPFVRDLLLSQKSLERGIFRKSYIERLIEMNDRGRSMDLPLWTLITFELWCRRFFDESSVSRSLPAASRRSLRARVDHVRADAANGAAVQCT